MCPGTAAFDAVGFGLLRCSEHGAYISVDNGAAASAAAAHELIDQTQQANNDRAIERLREAVRLPAAVDRRSGEELEEEPLPLVIFTQAGISNPNHSPNPTPPHLHPGGHH